MISCSFFFIDVVDLLDVLIGQFLDFGFRLAQLVFGQFRIFLKFLQLFVGISPEPADLHFRFFAMFFADLAQFLAAFFGERRKRHANDLSVVRRRHAQAGSRTWLFRFP